MRAIVIVAITAAASALSAAELRAAPAIVAAQQNATPLRQLIQGGYYGGYRPACPFGYYYACQYDRYLGYRQCACWPYFY